MNPLDDVHDSRPSPTDSDLIELVRLHLEPPEFYDRGQGSLSSRIMDRIERNSEVGWPRPRTSMAASVLAVSLGLLLSFPFFPGNRKTPTVEAVSFGQAGQWNYELFVPRELDEFTMKHRTRMLLPPEYNALEHWLE